MKFTIKKRNNSISDEQLIQDIKKVAFTLNTKVLAIREYDENGMFSSTTAIRRFGSWNKTMDICGLKHKNEFYTENEMLSNIRDVWLKLGKQPTRRNMDENTISRISSNVYLRHFGTWYNALDSFIKWIQNEDNDNIQRDKLSNTHSTKREPSNRLKVLVLMRDGNRCKLCGAKCNDGLLNIHFDHIVPWSKGGETVLENLQVLCSTCNEAKGNASL